jgi:hypothetical protein
MYWFLQCQSPFSKVHEGGIYIIVTLDKPSIQLSYDDTSIFQSSHHKYFHLVKSQTTPDPHQTLVLCPTTEAPIHYFCQILF